MPKQPDKPGPRHLRVILRNIAPLVHLNEPVSHRSVLIELTPEQRAQLSLQWVGSSCGRDDFEEVSKAFFEEDDNA